ncbi:MAG: hypothetical protein ABIC18_03550 [Candidatus Omnitrophota bacterium]
MKKEFILAVIFLSLISFTSIANCRNLTDQDWKIFYEAAEKWHASDWYLNEEEFNIICREIGVRYSFTADTVVNILVDVAKYGSIVDLEQECKILDELDEKYDMLPYGVTYEEDRQIHEKIAEKYNISLTELHAIEFGEEVRLSLDPSLLEKLFDFLPSD